MLFALPLAPFGKLAVVVPQSIGTHNVIESCIHQSVPYLIYTSTFDVVIGFNDIINGDETLKPPSDGGLFPSYGRTKLTAETLVLDANGRPLANGKIVFFNICQMSFCECSPTIMNFLLNIHMIMIGAGKDSVLKTISLRPSTMYGEGDFNFVYTLLRTARDAGGMLLRIGDGRALSQQSYAGNVAWAHICALQALQSDNAVAGRAYFVTDDTPPMNSFRFAEIVLEPCGYAVSKHRIPYWLAYFIMLLLEWMVLAARPFYAAANLKSTLAMVIYVNRTLYFNRGRAEKDLKYVPIYNFDTSLQKSIDFYKQLKL